MMGWGTAAARRASVILWLTGGVLVVTFALLWTEAEALAAEQGTYCLRSGPHTDLALWSNDGMRTWREP